MFNCSVCKHSIGPKISPIHVTTGTRPIAYHNEYYREDSWGNKELVKVDSLGTEITGEALVCPSCAGVEQSAGGKTIVRGAFSFQEKLAEPLRVKFVGCAVDSAIDRVSHKSQRAKQDTETVVPAIKDYLDVNKDLVF